MLKEKNSKELFDIEAEQIVLGAIMMNNEFFHKVSEFLRPEHFYVPAHQKIFTKIWHNIEKANTVADRVTLKQLFTTDDTIRELGGQQYITNLLAVASGIIISVVEYAKLIQDLFRKRELSILADDIQNRITNSEDQTSSSEQIEIAENQLFRLSESGGVGGEFRSLAFSMSEAINKTMLAKGRDSHISGISTGFMDLDKILGGMQQSDLIILAGRPSIGKTALGINIAINACKFLNKNLKEGEAAKGVGFFSLEMASDQLAARILSMESSVNAMKFRTGQIRDIELETVKKREIEMSKLPFFIDDTPALSISAIRTRARRLVRKHNLAFLVVDYLQLVRGLSTRPYETRVREISEITQGLKAIAKEFNIPVLALSQLSRAVEQREDKRPQLSDLRESGSIEQDADVVTFIYRDSYYHERRKPSSKDDPSWNEWNHKMNEIRNRAEVIIAKQRSGPIGTVSLYFDPEFTRFGNFVNG